MELHLLLLNEPVIRDRARRLAAGLVHMCERADLYGRCCRQTARNDRVLSLRYQVRARFARGMVARMSERLCGRLCLTDDAARLTMLTKLYLKGSTLPDWARSKEE